MRRANPRTALQDRREDSRVACALIEFGAMFTMPPKSDTALISCPVLRHTPKRERGEQLSPLAPLSPADHSEGVVFWMSMRNSALD